MPQSITQRGTTLIAVIIGMSIMLIVFGGFFIALNAYMGLAEHTHRRVSAMFVANEHIEKLRALPYNDIGTVGGLPNGAIPQIDTVVRDGRTYTIRTFIQYIDDPADGTDSGDTLAADYKRVKVEVSYTYRSTTKSISFVTNVAPKSQESLIGAGILRINVLDAENNPIPSATIHIVNTTVATSVDITTFTNASGTVSFPGAWEGPGYEVTVTKAGFSSAGTYTSAEAHNPSPSALTVGESSTTEIVFKIDLLSSILLYLKEIPLFGAFDEVFDDSTGFDTLTDTQTIGGILTLGGAPGTYSPSGFALSIPLSPASLGTWGLFRADQVIPPQTSIVYQFEYDTGGGVYALIPESDMPGNGVGFSASTTPLHTLDTSTYTSLRIRSTLTSTDPNVTPSITFWRVSYQEPDVPVDGVNVHVRGNNIYGTDASDAPVYRYDASHTTGVDGRFTIPDIEFDEYTITPSGVFVANSCPTSPVLLYPDTTLTETFTITAPTAHAYRVQILSPSGDPVPYTEVTVSAGADKYAQLTDECGFAYFPGLSATTYTVTTYTHSYASSVSTVTVSGLTEETITLSL